MELKDQKGLTEREFLEAYAKKCYPRPYLAADLVVFSQEDGQILLVKRKGHPFLGGWAIPGGFAKADETIEQTAARELREETGIECEPDKLTSVGIYSKPGRDPRGWVVTQAYMVCVEKSAVTLRAGDDAAEAAWFRLILDQDKQFRLDHGAERLSLNGSCSRLAFDHSEILWDAIRLYHQKRKEYIYA